MSFDAHRDYPLGSQRPDLVTTPRGIRVDELSLHGDGVQASELRVTSETLRLRAEVADAPRRSQRADTLRRGAGLALLPDEPILEISAALRPRRSSAGELESWAQRL